MRSPVTVVEVGPTAMRPDAGIAELARGAIEFIDDDLMLIEDEAVPVAEVWENVLRAALEDAVTPVVVYPTAWGPKRIEVVGAAARRQRPDVVLLSRSDVLRTGAETVVEIAEDIVVIAADDVTAVPRHGDSVVERVVRQVGDAGPVAVDAPHGVADAVTTARAIVAALHARGVGATVIGARALRRAVTDRIADEECATPKLKARPQFRLPRTPALAGAALTVVAVGVVGSGDPPPPAEPMAMLVEGRVGVVVPAAWTVRRITDGPGSNRLQAVSPADDSAALHVTQSPLPQQQSLEAIAATLRSALAAEPADVFSDFRPDDQRSGRQVVSYRERRGAAEVAWFVVVDGALRIAIGCQSVTGAQDVIRDACDAAVRSAHAVF